MKRYISLILVAVFLICCLAVPSYAAEYSDYFEVLDFTSANGVSNVHGLVRGDNYFFFELPSMVFPYGFDILVSSSVSINSAFVSFGVDRYELSVVSLGDNLYRFYGDFVHYNIDVLNLTVNTLSGGDIQFLSCKVFTAPDSVFDLPLDAVVSYGDGEEKYFSYPPTSDSYGVTFPGSDSYLYDEYSAYLYIDDYFKFDFLNIQVYLSQANFTSISASCGSVNIPISYSLINSDSSLSRFVVNLSIDCDSLRGLTDTLEIIFEGNTSGISSSVCYFGVLYSSGYVESSLPNEDLYFFNQMKTFLSGMFNNIGSWFSSLGNTFISSISSLGESLTASISGFRSDVISWIRNLQVWLEYISGQISSWSDTINKSIGSVASKIDNWGQLIVDAIIGNSDQVEQNEFIDNAVQQQEQINQELNVQLDGAVQDWNDNFDSVSGGYNTGFTKSTPALIWLSDKAQAVFNNMGWFGNMFFFLGFLHVFFLLMSKSGLGQVFKQKNGDD